MRIIRIITVLFLGIFLINGGCTKSPSEPDNDDKNKQEPFITIGPDGGTFTYGDFSLTVPSGAFGLDVELEVKVLDENHFAENSVSQTIQLSGLPEDYSKPMEVRIKYNGTLSEETYVAVGTEVFITSLNSREIGYTLFSARDSSDYLIFELPVHESNTGKIGKILKPVNGIGPIIHYFVGLTTYATHNTSESKGGHFLIKYPKSVPDTKVKKLGEDLEEAFVIFYDMGFDFSDKRTWPMVVKIMTYMNNDADGYFLPSFRGKNYNYIDLNIKLEPEQLRITAAHEFFHLIQEFYMPENKVWDYLWLKEASAVWSEELFSDKTDCYSSAREGNEDAPLYGMEYGAHRGQNNEGNHGYGMSALIKYLIPNYPTNSYRIVDIWERVKEGNHPVEAIFGVIYDPPSKWWEEFFRQYALGELYKDVDAMWWAGSFKGEFQINSDADISKTFTDNYPDLSGKVYRIKLNHKEISNHAGIKFTVSGENHKVTIFKYKRENKVNYIEYLGKSTENEVTISNIRSYTDEGWHLIALVTNCEAHPPDYISNSNIELKIEVTNELKEFFSKCVSIYIEFSAQLIIDQDKPEKPFTVGLLGSVIIDSRSDTTFSGTYTRDQTDYRIEDKLTATLNKGFDKINNVSFSRNWIPKGNNKSAIVSVNATDLPQTFAAENEMVFFIGVKDYFDNSEKKAFCGHISSFVFKGTIDGKDFTKDKNDINCEYIYPLLYGRGYVLKVAFAK